MVSPEPDRTVTEQATIVPAGQLGRAADVALDQPFDAQGLIALRAAVSAHASRLGLHHECLDDLVVMAHELASNAVRHGGGSGRLRLWRTDGTAYCEVSDSGGGLPDPAGAGHERVPLTAANGRGLWIVRQLADGVDVRSSAQGTTVTIALAVPES